MGALMPPLTETTPLPPLSRRAIFRGTGELGYSLDKRVWTICCFAQSNAAEISAKKRKDSRKRYFKVLIIDISVKEQFDITWVGIKPN